MIKKTLAGILLGANLIFNSCENYEKPQTNKIIEKQFPEDTLTNKAIEHYSKGEYELAKKDFQKYLEIKTQKNDSSGIARGLNNLALVLEVQGNYEKASENYTNALKIYENLQDSFKISKAYNNLGIVFDKQGKDDKSLEYFDKSLDIKKALNDSLGVSLVLNNIGTIFDKQNKNEMALIHYFNSLKIAEKINNEAQKADCYNNIANIYRKEDNLGKALEYFQKSEKINKNVGDKRNLAINLLSIGEIYLKNKDPSQALLHLNKSLSLAQEINSPELLKDIYKIFSETHEDQNKPDSALKYFKLFSEIKDTLFNEQGSKQINELMTIYETEKKEADNEMLRKDNQIIEEKNEKQQWGLLGLGAFLGLSGLLAYSFYRGRKKEKQAKEIIQEKNKNITDSIKYASEIQQSFLPEKKTIEKLLPDSFILYKPKDIVSGDFYWLAEKNNKTYFAACDCTGHGVPGALMNALNNSLLNEALNVKQIEKPNEIFDYVREGIIQSLKSSSEAGEHKDGMDAVLCSWDKQKNTLEFACAKNPLYLIRDNELKEFKEDKMPVGYQEDSKPFSYNKIELKKNDLIYIFSDGYSDQFGGNVSNKDFGEGKKFMKKNLKKLLLSIQKEPMEKQKEILEEKIENWKGTLEQADDLLVMGIKV